MKRRQVGNPLALAVLALLTEHPTHPYDIGRTLRQRHKEESIKLNYGSLYTVLEQLVRAGFVAKRETVRETARPERTIYEITESGYSELIGWMSELVSTPSKEFRAFEAALALLGVLKPEDARQLLTLRLERLRVHIREQRAEMDGAIAGGLHPFHLVEGEYRLALEKAEASFVEGLLTTMEDAKLMRMWREFHESRERRQKGRGRKK
jgi:DNA-binding PadR family transcriptional regulator